MSSPASSTSQGVVERVQTFVAENKRVILIGAALTAVAIGGAAYYASTSGSLGGGDSSSDKAERKKDKKKGKKRKSTRDEEMPILEEIVPPPATAQAPQVAEVPEEDADLTPAQIAGMTDDEKSKAAARYKAKGNSSYQKRDFSTAAEFYTKAIDLSPKAEPVYFSNRAACYMNMSPPLYEKVVEDCDQALALDKTYVKALNRRGTALEALDRYEGALRDFTACTIMERFANEATAGSVERVLKKLSTQRAAEILATREPRLPSHTFVSAYFGAFRPRPPPSLPENPSTGDNTLVLGIQALENQNYAHALTLVNEAIDQGISFDLGKAEAFNLRGTFKFLMGDVVGSKDDLTASLEIVPSLTQSWVKIASVHMEQGDPQKAFECFEEAIKHNANDADIYYHRGQVHFIMNEFSQAAEDYTKSTALDDKFVFSHIQLAVAQYKSGNLANSMATFRRTLKAFPNRSEPQNYYGELLLDQSRFQDAVDKFDRAIEIENSKPPPVNVLPIVNKGLALFQWKEDIVSAEKCCEEALKIDPECEAAVATLAQLSLQQSKTARAAELFDRQIELARSEPELSGVLQFSFATKAQLEFMDNHPEMVPQLSQIARAV